MLHLETHPYDILQVHSKAITLNAIAWTELYIAIGRWTLLSGLIIATKVQPIITTTTAVHRLKTNHHYIIPSHHPNVIISPHDITTSHHANIYKLITLIFLLYTEILKWVLLITTPTKQAFKAYRVYK